MVIYCSKSIIIILLIVVECLEAIRQCIHKPNVTCVQKYGTYSITLELFKYCSLCIVAHIHIMYNIQCPSSPSLFLTSSFCLFSSPAPVIGSHLLEPFVLHLLLLCIVFYKQLLKQPAPTCMYAPLFKKGVCPMQIIILLIIAAVCYLYDQPAAYPAFVYARELRVLKAKVASLEKQYIPEVRAKTL